MMVQFDYARCGPAWFLAETRTTLAYPTHERVLGLTEPLLVRHWAQWLAAQTDDGEAYSTPQKRHNAIHSAPDAAQPIIRFAQTVTSSSATRGDR